MLSDAELVAAVLKGDREAFTSLMRRYEPLVLAVAIKVLCDRHAAEDAAQNAFVSAYENLGRLRKPSAFAAWIVKIAHRQAIGLARRTPRASPLDSAEEPACKPSNGRLDTESQQLLAAILKLPKNERQVVTLRYFGGHSVQETAEMTGRSVGTVTKQLSRAHQRLRSRLKEY
jgi:RNA polymerase sigma-70 factor (ECF subfamily)